MAIDGKYRLIFNYPFARMKVLLDLATAEGSGLTGMRSGGGFRPAALADGRVEGQRLSWKVLKTPFPFICAATVDGDAIRGEADFGFLGKAWMRGSRVDLASGKSSIDDEPAIAWKDMGLPRYEMGSVEWVNALGEWLHSRFEGHILDFDFRWSTEYADPPQHLLRSDGRKTIGWHFVIKEGQFEFGDGPLDGDLDFGGTPIPYAFEAKRARMHTDEMVALQERDLPSRLSPGEGQMPLTMTEQRRYRTLRLNGFTAGPDNVIREQFFSQRTL